MICHDYLIFFSDFIDKRLSEEQKQAIEQHCLHCKECSMAWKELVENAQKIRDLRRFSLSPSFVLDVMNHLEKKQSATILKMSFYPMIALAACILLGITTFSLFFYYDSKIAHEEQALALSAPKEESLNTIAAEKETKEEENENENEDIAFSLDEESKKALEPSHEIAMEAKQEEKQKTFELPALPPSASMKKMAVPSAPIAQEKRAKETCDTKADKKASLSFAASDFFLSFIQEKNLKKTTFGVFSFVTEKAKGKSINDIKNLEIALVSINSDHDIKFIGDLLKTLPETTLWEWEGNQKKVFRFQSSLLLEEAREILSNLQNSFQAMSSAREDFFSGEKTSQILIVLWLLEF